MTEAKEAWLRVAVSSRSIGKLRGLAVAVVDSLETGSEDWSVWKNAVRSVDDLMLLHDLGCPMRPDDPEASRGAYPVLLDSRLDDVSAELNGDHRGKADEF